jgi:hypothetical protein
MDIDYGQNKGKYYLATGPNFYIYLSKTDDNQNTKHYFIPLSYSTNKGFSKGTVQKPVIGTYEVTYYEPLPGKEKKCNSLAENVNTVPDPDYFKQILPGKTFAGNYLELKSDAPSKVDIKNKGADISITAIHRSEKDTFTAGVSVSVSGIDRIKASFKYKLYASDKNGTLKNEIACETVTDNLVSGWASYTRLIAVIIPAPGDYYFRVKEESVEPAEFFKPNDSMVLYHVQVAYEGLRLVAREISIQEGNATRVIHVEGEEPVKIKITDPVEKNSVYTCYGPYEEPYPYQYENKSTTKSPGTFSGAPSTKFSHSDGSSVYTIDMPHFEPEYLKTFVYVKSTAGKVDRSHTFYIQFGRHEYRGGTVIAWRIRTVASFNYKYVETVPQGTSFTKVTPGKGKVKLTWKKQTKGTKGYIIEYTRRKDFSATKKLRIDNNTKTSATIGKLASGDTYYFRICTYSQPSVTKKIPSKWSATKSAVIK